MVTKLIVIQMMMTVVEGFHPLNAFGMGFFPIIKEGTVGLVYKNGALQDVGESWSPGMGFSPKAYLGTTIVPMSVTEEEDVFPRETSPPARVKSKQGTPWSVRVNVRNQVDASDMPTVVRRLTQDYDSKIGSLVPSVLKEVFVQLDDTVIRESTSINERTQIELIEQMERNWGKEFASKISIPYVTVEHLECENKDLQRQWDEQVRFTNEEATSRRKAEADKAEHARKAAEERASHARTAAAEEATQQRALAAAAAAAKRATMEAEAISAVAAIENQRIVDAAKAQAEATKIRSDAEVAARRDRYAAIENSMGGAAYDLQMDHNKAIHNNEKIHKETYVIPDSIIQDTGGLVGSAKNYFQQFL